MTETNIAIQELEKVDEFDEEIKYKHDYLNIRQASIVSMKAFENWINLNLTMATSLEIDKAYSDIQEMLVLEKKAQTIYDETKMRFFAKHI